MCTVFLETGQVTQKSSSLDQQSLGKHWAPSRTSANLCQMTRLVSNHYLYSARFIVPAFQTSSSVHVASSYKTKTLIHSTIISTKIEKEKEKNVHSFYRVVKVEYSGTFYVTMPVLKFFKVVTQKAPMTPCPGFLGDQPDSSWSHFRSCKLFTYRATIYFLIFFFHSDCCCYCDNYY